jgi:uncharacterized membrane-anchored protein YitT (DUF2179 family)
MSLDFYFTNSLSGGDYSLEANAIGRWWWEIAGPLRFVEIPIYAFAVLGSAYVINYKYKFFPIFWLNLLAFNHLLGFLSWVSYSNLEFIYSFVRYEWQTPYAFSLISIFLSLPLSLIQLRFKRYLRI